MNAMLVYAVKSAVLLAALYIPYVFLLRNEAFVRMNRVVLLGIMAASVTLPFVNLPFLVFGHGPMLLPEASVEVGLPMLVPGMENVAEAGPVVEAEAGTDWMQLLTVAYLCGVVLSLAVRTVQAIALRRSMRSGLLWTNREQDGTVIYCHAGCVQPFSWFKGIVVSQDDMDDCGEIILAHEKAHARMWHSADLLLAMACEALQWFSPFVWMLADNLRDVHEYEADRRVLASGTDIRQYQLLLIKKTVGKAWPAFTNSLRTNQLKKRFKMMQQKQSSPWRRTRALYVLPISLLALSVFAKNAPVADDSIVPSGGNDDDVRVAVVVDGQLTSLRPDQIREQDIKSMSKVENPKGVLEGKCDVAYYIDLNDDDRVFDVCEVLPQYPGGQNNLMAEICQNIRYPKEGMELGLSGRIMVQFIIERNGRMSNIKVLKNTVADGLTEGEYTDASGVTVIGYGMNADNSIVTKEQRDGVLKKFEDECVRVVSQLKAWTPGMQRGKAVRVKFAIPVSFRLN